MASQGGPRKRGTAMKLTKIILKQQMSIAKWVIGPSQCPWLFNKGSLKCDIQRAVYECLIAMSHVNSLKGVGAML